jgi:D-alanyl-D-alanine carboxypeptidase/D-alanyl-D-alanine-endopeptidase (penicillin-binding protein 4)
MKIKSLIIIILLTVGISFSKVDYDSAKVYRETFLSPLTLQDSLKSISDLGSSINALLNNKYIRKSDYTIAIYSLDQKKYFYINNIEKALTPASCTKLFTSFAALRQLSRNFFITTEIYTDGNLTDSVIDGNLYIKGGGDGMLQINDLDYLAEEINNLGIRKITGNIYADDTYFDDIWEREDYANDKDMVVNLPPVTSLSIENNTATVLIKSGSHSGRYVDVQLIPNSETFGKWITAKVASADILNTNDTITLQIDAERYGDELLALASGRRGSIRVSTKLNDKDGRQLFTISGYLSRNRTRSYRFHIIDPPLAVAGAMKNRLINSNIEVDGNVLRGSIDSIPEGKKMFVCEKGRNIKEMIAPVLKNSDNYLAENLFKIIGASAGGQDSTAEMSRKIIRLMMSDLEIPFDNCLLNDGSGLSRRNLLSAESLINLLIRIDEMGFYEDFYELLSIAGEDGTLEKRMRRTSADGNLRAKTGTLRNASALSGYVTTLDGERLAFAMVFNGRYVSHFKETENKIGILLSQFFYYNSQN